MHLIVWIPLRRPGLQIFNSHSDKIVVYAILACSRHLANLATKFQTPMTKGLGVALREIIDVSILISHTSQFRCLSKTEAKVTDIDSLDRNL